MLETTKELSVIRTLQKALVAHWKAKGPWKSVRAFGRLVTSRQRISDIIGVVRATNTAALIMRRPGTVLKWSDKYLINNLSLTQRSHIFAFHYRFVGARIDDTFYARLLSGGFDLWKLKTDAAEVVLQLRCPKSSREGDLSLVMILDRVDIYELSFTVVPGEIIHALDPVIFVARVQGRRKRFEAIKTATKLCCDVSPPYILLAAIEGIAAALGVQCVAGVSNVNQVCAPNVFNYENFWEALSFEKAGRNCYASTLPMTSRPLDQCSPGHRRRTKKKRSFKADIAISAQNSFECQCLKVSSKIDRELYEFHLDAANVVAVAG